MLSTGPRCLPTPCISRTRDDRPRRPRDRFCLDSSLPKLPLCRLRRGFRSRPHPPREASAPRTGYTGIPEPDWLRASIPRKWSKSHRAQLLRLGNFSELLSGAVFELAGPLLGDPQFLAERKFIFRNRCTSCSRVRSGSPRMPSRTQRRRIPFLVVVAKAWRLSGRLSSTDRIPVTVSAEYSRHRLPPRVRGPSAHFAQLDEPVDRYHPSRR
jgi:hypothetical protein